MSARPLAAPVATSVDISDKAGGVSHEQRLKALQSYTPKAKTHESSADVAADLTAELHKLALDTEVKRDFEDFTEGEQTTDPNTGRNVRNEWLMQQNFRAMRMAEYDAQRQAWPAQGQREAPAPPAPADPNYAANIPSGQFFPNPGPAAGPPQQGGPGFQPQQGGPGFNPGAPPPAPAQPRRKGPSRKPFRFTAEQKALDEADYMYMQMTPTERMRFNSLGLPTLQERYLKEQGTTPSWKYALAQIKFTELSPHIQQREYPGGWEEWLQKNPFEEEDWYYEGYFSEPWDAATVPQPRGPKYERDFGATNKDGEVPYKPPADPPQLVGGVPLVPDSAQYRNVIDRQGPNSLVSVLENMLRFELFPELRPHFNYPFIYRPPGADGAVTAGNFMMYPVMNALKFLLKAAPDILDCPLEVFIGDLADLYEQGPGMARLNGWQFKKLRGTRPAVDPRLTGGPSDDTAYIQADDETRKELRTFNPARTKLLIMAVVLIEKVSMVYRNRTASTRFYKTFGARETRDMVVARLARARAMPEGPAKDLEFLPPRTKEWNAYRQAASELRKFEVMSRDLIYRWEGDVYAEGNRAYDTARGDRAFLLKVRRGPDYLAYFTPEWKAWWYVEFAPPIRYPRGWDSVLKANPISPMITVNPGEAWPVTLPTVTQLRKDLQLQEARARGAYRESKLNQLELDSLFNDIAGDTSPGEAGFGGGERDYTGNDDADIARDADSDGDPDDYAEGGLAGVGDDY